VKLALPARQGPCLLSAGLARARTPEHAEAAQLTEAGLKAVAKPTANQCYDAACAFGLCAATARPEARTAEAYAVRAVELLRRAMEAGYRNVKELEEDEDLTALRGRADYRAVVEEMRNRPR
jgi:hypothetical protein